jgi:hypothetical protein
MITPNLSTFQEAAEGTNQGLGTRYVGNTVPWLNVVICRFERPRKLLAVLQEPGVFRGNSSCLHHLRIPEQPSYHPGACRNNPMLRPLQYEINDMSRPSPEGIKSILMGITQVERASVAVLPHRDAQCRCSRLISLLPRSCVVINWGNSFCFQILSFRRVLYLQSR